MRSFLIAIVLILVTYQHSFAQRELKNPLINSGEIINAGVELHDKGKYKEAIVEYLKVPQSDTNYSRVLHELILSYYNDSNFVAAEKYAKYGIEHFPENSTDWLALLADVYDDTKRTPDALKAYDTILAQKPYDYLTHFNKGVSLFRAERYDEAALCFQKCVMINPYYTSGHYFLGKISLLKGNLVPAIMSFTTNLLISPGNRYQRNSVSFLTSIAEVNTDVVAFLQKYKVGKDDNFDEIQDIITSKIALDKKYKLKVDLEDPIVRQIQVLAEKLEYNANDKGFWMQYYVPMFKKIWDNKRFEASVNYMFSELEIKKVKDFVKKEKRDVEAMSTDVVDYLSEIRASQEIIFSKREGTKVRLYSQNYNIIGKGEYSLNSKKESILVGVWEFYHKNGRLKSKGNFNSEGNRDGEWRFYYDNAILHEITFYRDGKAQGKSESWHDNGIRYELTNYKDDELDGEAKTFFYNGLPRMIVHYKMGKKDGLAKYYDVDGNLSSAIKYADDKQEGEEITYHTNGKIKSKVNYSNDEPVGVYTSYYDDGKVKLTGQYEGGKKTGLWKSSYKSGKIEYTDNYVKGLEDGEYISYFENGKIRTKSFYRKGEVDGKKEDYDDDGILFCETIMERGRLKDIKFFDKKGQVISNTTSRKGNANIAFYLPDGSKSEDGYFNKDGTQEGKATYYYKNGKTSVEANYNDGLLEGKRTAYFINGIMSQEGNYKSDKANGYFVNYYSNGSVSNEGWYVDGDAQGTFIYYDLLGNKSSKVYYLNDQTHGVSEYFHPNGKPDYTEYYDNAWFKKLVQFDTTGKIISSAELDKGESKVIFKHFNGKPYIECYYKNYKLNGLYKIINGDGTIRSIAYYKNGDRDSIYKAWYPNGKLQTEGYYTNGDKTGEWKYYWRSGQLSEVENYVEGKLDGKDIQYNEDGAVEKEMLFKKGDLEGEYRIYGDAKQLAVVMYYKADELLGYSYEDKNGALVPMIAVPRGSGKVTAYYKNGTKSLEMLFNESLVDGERNLYYSNGKERIIGQRVIGWDNGAKKLYYPNGKIMKEENYIYGNLHGNSKYYNENGSLIYDINFYNGDLHGNCKYYENGKLTENLTYYYGMLEEKK